MTGPEHVRVGFLGAGLISHYHALQLSRCPEPHDVVAVYDTDPARAAGFAEGWGCDAVSNATAVVDACDAVFVCTWTAAHLEGVREAAMAGRAVFCEKPLSVDLTHAHDAVALVEST